MIFNIDLYSSDLRIEWLDKKINGHGLNRLSTLSSWMNESVRLIHNNSAGLVVNYSDDLGAVEVLYLNSGAKQWVAISDIARTSEV